MRRAIQAHSCCDAGKSEKVESSELISEPMNEDDKWGSMMLNSTAYLYPGMHMIGNLTSGFRCVRSSNENEDPSGARARTPKLYPGIIE